ncbi:uncharacterized protein [Atheta coriaria]|uniref:uncharacterized protein isoform X1 n=2 Tax=Dalotia coriaria TaxID=877792 RepID=UPI0031F46437
MVHLSLLNYFKLHNITSLSVFAKAHCNCKNLFQECHGADRSLTFFAKMLPPTFVKGFHDEEAVKKMKYKTFGQTGMTVSRLGMGGAVFSDLFGAFTFEESKNTLLLALKSGINYIDTAPWYGQGVSETTIGKALEGVPREAYYIATKVCRYERDPKKMFDFSAEKTRQSFEESLKRLKLDYVDVLQIHDMDFAPSIDYLLKETWPVLMEFKRQGKARFIGVTGYTLSKLAEFVGKCGEIDTVLNYGRMTLHEQAYVQYKDNFKNLGILNGAVLAMGLFTNNGPQSWHPADAEIRAAAKGAIEYCQKNDVDIAKLALAFSFENYGDVVLNGMNTP